MCIAVFVLLDGDDIYITFEYLCYSFCIATQYKKVEFVKKRCQISVPRHQGEVRKVRKG